MSDNAFKSIDWSTVEYKTTSWWEPAIYTSDKSGYVYYVSNTYPFVKETDTERNKRLEAEKQAQAIHDDIQDVDFS
jgi:hypothetical protein